MWAIVTSATIKYASGALPAAKIPAWPALVTADDVSKGKPNPEPYLTGAKKLGLDAKNCEWPERSAQRGARWQAAEWRGDGRSSERGAAAADGGGGAERRRGGGGGATWLWRVRCVAVAEERQQYMGGWLWQRGGEDLRGSWSRP